jgi:hypothetical protein
MPGKWNIDMHSPYARFPEFDSITLNARRAIVEEMRNNIIKQIGAQTEAVVKDAIPKALQAQCGMAFKSELILEPARPLHSKGNVVTHKVRFMLTEFPPNGWNWLPYESIKELWEKHRG